MHIPGASHLIAQTRRPRPRGEAAACRRLASWAWLLVGWLGQATAAQLPTGFNESLVVANLASPTAMTFAPDGRLFVCQQAGQLRVVKGGVLLSPPFVTLTTDPTGERGLLGVAVHPGFATNGWMYVHYTVPGSPSHNRVSRFTADGDVAAPGSETIILELDELSDTPNHNGGALGFGADGKLYIATGDNTRGFKAPLLDNLLGKILRVNPDGSIPSDNPFLGQTVGTNRAIWATGLRNPFSFAIQPVTGRMFINDVGEVTWEEINDGSAGVDYGWPAHEGPAPDDLDCASPLFAYGHGIAADDGCAITGGAFYNPSVRQFPLSFVGRYFYADFCGDWIRVLDPADPDHSEAFATGVSGPVGLAVGPEGALYYLSRDGGRVLKIEAASGPGIVTHPTNQFVQPGGTATFTVTASGSSPLAYQWRSHGTNLAGATSSSYSINNATLADNGTPFSVVVTNIIGSVTSNPALLIVTTSQPPVVTITLPASGAKYRGGESVGFGGVALGDGGLALPAENFSWTVVFHHDQHTHPFLGPIVGVTNGSFTIPTTGETSSEVFLRVQLTVTNAVGQAGCASVDLLPHTSVFTLLTEPPGLSVTLGGQSVATPLSVTGVVGIVRTLGVVSSQVLNGTNFGFLKWSDGGAATHGIATPETNTTYVANFISDQSPPVLNLAKAGTDLRLSWPAISTGFVVQATRTLTPTVPWLPATNFVLTNGMFLTTTADVSRGSAFFRLAAPALELPRLSFSQSGAELRLRWPTQAAEFVLQTAASPTASALWQPATNFIVTSNGCFEFTTDISTGRSFFRLAAPKLPPPQLEFARTGSMLHLRWPTPAAGFSLETTPSLTPVVRWTLLTNPITVVDEQHQVWLAAPHGSQFFRLMKP